MAEPRRESPLGHSPADAAPAGRGGPLERPGLRVEELAFRPMLVLHGSLGAPGFAEGVARVLGCPPPDTPNTFSEARFGGEPAVLAWTGPEEWLAIGGAPGTSGLGVALRQAIPEADGAVVDASSGWTLISLDGARARDLIAADCPVDVHPRAFGPGRCVRTVYARVGVCLLQRDAAPRFEMAVPRSRAAWLWRRLEAAAELAAVE